MQELATREKEVTSEEIKEILKNPSITGNERNKYQQIAAEMEQIKSALLIPCISGSDYFKKPTLIAAINLGKKKSEEPFSREDLDFLTTLANQSVISVEYAFIVEELRKNQDRVVQSEKLAALGNTTAGIAHELKNPLTYLSTVSQILPSMWDDAAFRKNVNEMLPAEIQRMQMIVEGLLAYSREKPLLLQPTDIQAVLEKTLAILTFEIRKSKVDVKTHYQHNNAKALGDANRLVQVFMNIINNAVQAMSDHGGELNITTEVDDNNFKIFIKDSGPGISRENQKKLFDPFFTTKESGTGLGLAISKKIVDEHSGSITVDSFPSRGTVFIIHLPKAK
jgi:signal transduction histidine kinase